MNFFNSELSPDLMQANTTSKITKLNTQISFDKDKLPTKIINNNLNNKFNTNNTVINTGEIKNKINYNNFNKKEDHITDIPQNEIMDFNNLLKNINEEKNKTDKPLITYNNITSSISEVLFNKPAPLNFTKLRNLSKSCTRLEIENIKNKLNENLENENTYVKSNTAFCKENKNIKFDKSFDAFSNCDIELRNLNRKINLEDDLTEVEKEAYGYTNEINRNFKGEMKFNLEEIDNFLNNENVNDRNNNKKININGKISEDKDININDQKIEEAINKEMRIIKKMSAEIRSRIDTLSTSDIQDKDGPILFSENDLHEEIYKIKSQVLFIFL